MEYKKFGNTGLLVSPSCLGTMSYSSSSENFPWVLPEAESRSFIQKALELDINFFDTADVYNQGNAERVLGKAMCDFR